jgi:hypothetical protein
VQLLRWGFDTISKGIDIPVTLDFWRGVEFDEKRQGVIATV